MENKQSFIQELRAFLAQKGRGLAVPAALVLLLACGFAFHSWGVSRAPAETLSPPAAPGPGDAASGGVSEQVSLLVEDVRRRNGKLSAGDLSRLTEEELRQLRDAGAPGLPVGADGASYAAQSYAGVLEMDSVTADVDPELDKIPAHYDVELHLQGLGDFDYTVDAYTGDILSGEKDILNPAPAQDAPGASQAPASGGLVGESRAKEIALERAGIAEEDTSCCNVWLEYDDGRPECYEVEFAVPGGWEYGYKIDPYAGAVLKSWTVERRDAPQSSGEPSIESAFAAWSIAFEDAGVREDDVTGLQTKTDWEDGVQVYEIEFRCGGTEYDYEISAADGSILKREQKDAGHSGRAPVQSAVPDSPTFIGTAAAKEAALDHAGVSAGEARHFQCELDRDGGLYRYEIEFDTGTAEYEYEVDAVTGMILKAEMD